MSDTLRTDTLLIAHDMSPEPKVLINHARALERALNNADARIRRLEEAGDALKASGYFGGWADAVNKWIKAREVKP